MPQKDSLSKSAFIYTVTGFTSKGISFLILPLYSYFFTTAEFGIISLMMAVYTIAAVLFQFGLPALFPKFYIEAADEEKRGVTGYFLVRYLIWAFILFVIGYFCSGSLSGVIHRSELYEKYYQILFLTLLIDTLGLVAIQYFRTELLAGKAGLLQLLFTMANTLTLIVLLLNGVNNISAVVFAQLIASGMQCFIALYMMRGKIQIGEAALPSQKLLKFAFPIMVGGLFSSLLDVADRFLLAGFISEDQVGVYSFGYRIALGIQVFVIAFRTAWTPTGIRLVKTGEYTRRSGAIFRQLIYAIVFFFILVLLISKIGFYPLVGDWQLFSPGFYESMMVIPIIAFAYVLNAFVSYFSIYPYTTDSGSYFLKMDLLGIIVNILLNILLIPFLGIVGAALATLISYTAILLYISSVSVNHIAEGFNISGILIPVLIIAMVVVLFYTVSNIPVILLSYLTLAGYTVYKGGFSIKSIFTGNGLFGISKKSN